MQTIAFTTGLDPAEAPAIATAAALAAASGARLVTVHATAGAPPARALPHPEELASRWGAAIAHDELIHTCCEDVTDTLLDALRRVKPELVVSGTHQRTGLSQLFGGSVAESVARNIAVPTLVVPLVGQGLADAATGALDLRRILVPSGDAETASKGLEAAAWLARAAGAIDPEVVVLHVDDGTPMPTFDAIPDGLRVVTRTAKGSLEEAIAKTAEELSSCALVMATRGHDGLVDTFAGSHTERVVRKVHCPVLVVPMS
jgi:nucleotide-binding universal stress UspA family protein